MAATPVAASTMDARRWLLVLAVAALGACAIARPGDLPNEIPTPKPTNEEGSKDVHVKTEESKDSSHSTLAANKDDEASNAVVKADEKPEQTEKPESKKDEATKTDVKKDEPEKSEDKQNEKINAVEVSKAVNELYPHAVLFGGTCGGSIIGSKWILTAGHCTIFSSGRHILAGTNRSDDGSGVIRRVKRLILHPKFSVGPYWVDADQFGISQVAADWDFLLAELEEPLPLDGVTIAAVELNDEPQLPAGLRVGYAGYGAAEHGEYMRSEMHGMELEVKEDSVCQEALVQYEPKTMICTKGRPPRFDSACNGDSGSGLVSNGKLYGVASWVQDDAHRCFNGALVVFSRVSAVRDWIRQVTKI